MARETKTSRDKALLVFALLLVGSQEGVFNVPRRGQLHTTIPVTHLTLRFVCPRCTREMADMAAKLPRCGIASEALRRNYPLVPKSPLAGVCSWNGGPSCNL